MKHPLVVVVFEFNPETGSPQIRENADDDPEFKRFGKCL